MESEKVHDFVCLGIYKAVFIKFNDISLPFCVISEKKIVDL